MGYFVKNRGSGRTPSGTLIPSGDTASQPTNTIIGMLRYNSDTLLLEYFNGTSFVSILNEDSVSNIIVDTFTGDNIETVFTMTQAETIAAQILVFIGGVNQQPTLSYTVSGTDLTFLSPPPLNQAISVLHNI
jgi:hypothetical protein